MEPRNPPEQPVTDWSPERKVVGAAVATIILAVVQAFSPELEIPLGVEGAVAVVTAYFVPNKH